MILQDIILLLKGILGKILSIILLYTIITPLKGMYYILRSLINLSFRFIKLGFFIISSIFNGVFISLIKGIPFLLLYAFQFCLDIFVLSINLVKQILDLFIKILNFISSKINYFYKNLDFYRKLLNNIMFNKLLRKSVYKTTRLSLLKYKKGFITYLHLNIKKFIYAPLTTFLIAIKKVTVISEKNILTSFKKAFLFTFNIFTFCINSCLLIFLILKYLYSFIISIFLFKNHKKLFLIIYNAKLIIIKEVVLDLKLFFNFIINLPSIIFRNLGYSFNLFYKFIKNMFFWSKNHYLKTSFLVIIFMVSITNLVLVTKNHNIFLNNITQSNNKVSITNIAFLLVNFCTNIKNNLDIKYNKIVLNIKDYKTLNQELLNNNINCDEANSISKAVSSVTNAHNLKLNGEISATLVTSKQKDGIIKVSQLEIPLNNSYNLIIEPTEDNSSFTVYKQKKKLNKYFIKQSFVINDNYYISANNSQIPSSIIHTLSKILSWHIDFQRDISSGNQVEVLYQVTSDLNNMTTSNKLIYATIKLNHKTLVFYNYKGHFYLQNGRSASMALLRTPVEGYRISSPFGKRSHPILGYSIFHKGIDFAAPTGTPVPASGNGIIKRVSISPTFGKVIEIQHNAYLSTRYAHLNAFAKNITVGKVVSQRDIIGYIGSTGRATGPHLHYEVHFNGYPVNPVDVKLPSSFYISEENLLNFNNYKTEIKQILLKIPLNQKVSINFNEV